MSETKWSPEPWTFDEYGHVRHAGMRSVCLSGFSLSTGYSGGHGESEVNDRRIVACVNALAGIPIAALESGKLGEALDRATDVLQHTDPECDETNCQTKRELIAALCALGRFKP